MYFEAWVFHGPSVQGNAVFEDITWIWVYYNISKNLNPKEIDRLTEYVNWEMDRKCQEQVSRKIRKLFFYQFDERMSFFIVQNARRYFLLNFFYGDLTNFKLFNKLDQPIKKYWILHSVSLTSVFRVFVCLFVCFTKRNN